MAWTRRRGAASVLVGLCVAGSWAASARHDGADGASPALRASETAPMDAERSTGLGAESDTDWSLIENRLWVRRSVRSEGDKVGYLVLRRSPGGVRRDGVVGDLSEYEQRSETLRWYPRVDDRVDIELPHKGRRGTFWIYVYECWRTQFDVCLELRADGHELLRLYSYDEWTFDPEADQVELLQHLITLREHEHGRDMYPHLLQAFMPLANPPEPEAASPAKQRLLGGTLELRELVP